MQSGESFPIGGQFEQEEQAVALKLDVIDLGPNNIGQFGTDNFDETVAEQAMRDTAKPEYSRPYSGEWICVDGRCSQEEFAAAQTGEDKEAAGQIAGSLPISETGSDFMADPHSGRPLSQRIAENTQQEVADGCRPIVHGDNKAGKSGCKANVLMREGLLFNGENADIVAPKAWAVMEAIGASAHLEQDDITTAINNGVAAAKRSELWDVNAEQVIDIAVASGARYQEYIGDHAEAGIRLDATSKAFAKARYVIDHTSGDRVVQFFSATMGLYFDEAMRRAKLRGQSGRDAALKTMRVALYNIGISKMLSTENSKVGLISAQQ